MTTFFIVMPVSTETLFQTVLIPLKELLYAIFYFDFVSPAQ